MLASLLFGVGLIVMIRSVPTIQVEAGVQAAKLIGGPAPEGTSSTRQPPAEGVVRLAVIINGDGTVDVSEIVSGPPLLVAGAIEIVRKWRYEKTFVKGRPVKVKTTVDIAFPAKSSIS